MPFPLKILDPKKLCNGQTTDGRTDQLTDGRTDRPSYRDAWTHLKRKQKMKKGIKNKGKTKGEKEEIG